MRINIFSNIFTVKTTVDIFICWIAITPEVKENFLYNQIREIIPVKLFPKIDFFVIREIKLNSLPLI